ncbi:MAG: hypothetical protein SFV17_06465 [Candidatus Obscuribacter sp.]|nr:hypothetical protein [Candidatus Obscuribacter sp.]
MNSLPVSAAQNSSCDETSTPIGYFKTRRKVRSSGPLEKNGNALGEDSANRVININFQKSSLVQSQQRKLDSGASLVDDFRLSFTDKLAQILASSESLSQAAPDTGDDKGSGKIKQKSNRAFHVELSTAGTSAALNLYEECTMDELKRTARSLALQNDSIEEGEEGRHVTSDKLPLITAPLRLTAGCAFQRDKQPQRRSLLAPPRTRVLGFGDAEALLNIIESTQERRSRELEKRSREQTALTESTETKRYCPRSTNLDLQALARPGVLKKALQKTFKAAKREMVKLLDKLALA